MPFNISCGRCRNCKEGKTGVCLNVNPDRPGSAYGYVDMGGWVGGQAEYVMVPYADWNLLRFPDKDQAMEKILDLAMLSDIFPTGYHGCVTAGVTTGSTVYIAGAGPVGLAAATSAFLLGAAVVIVGDLNEERLAQARSFGCETVDVSQGRPGGADRADPRRARGRLRGRRGRLRGARPRRRDAPTRAAGDRAELADGHHPRRRRARHPRPLRHRRPGRASTTPRRWARCRSGSGLGWAKSHAFFTGQCPVMRYNRQLMMAILHDRVQIAKNVNATAIPLDQAPQGYQEFDQGAARKYVLDPHGLLGRRN